MMHDILKRSFIAASNRPVRDTSSYINLPATTLLNRLKTARVGEKDGGDFLRSALKLGQNGKCLSRSNTAAESMASILVIDADRHFCKEDKDTKAGAPPAVIVSEILREEKIGFILFGTFSHYGSEKGERYRIMLCTSTPYTKTDLPLTVASLVDLINYQMPDVFLVNSPENAVWSQPWYFPRRPADSKVGNLYFENLEGNAVEVVQPKVKPIPSGKCNTRKFLPRPIFSSSMASATEISVVDAFNDQYPVSKLLMHFGYHHIYTRNETEKWLSPGSESGAPGITVDLLRNRFFCHHASEPFCDGYWHSSFDLFMTRKGLSFRDAVIAAAKHIRAPDGGTADEFNKRMFKKNKLPYR